MKPGVDTRRDETPRARDVTSDAPWTWTTAVWTIISALIPVNYALPSAVRSVWFIAIMATIGGAALLWRVARPVLPAIWIFTGFAAVVAVATATRSATVGENVFVGAQLVLLLGLGPFVLTRAAVADSSFASRAALGFLVGQTLSAAVAVSQLLGSTIQVPGFVYGAVYGRASGLTEHPNTLGVMSCIAILLSMRMCMDHRRLRLLALSAMATNAIGLISSGSLTAVLALACGVAVLVVSRRDALGKVAVFGLAAAGAVALIVSKTGIVEYFPSLTARYLQVTGSAKTSSWEARKQTYDFAWDSITRDPLFGNGLSTRTSGTFNGVITVHNLVLRAWYQGGLLLAIGFGLLVLGMVVVVVTSMARKRNGVEAGVIVAILVYASVSPVLEQRHFWIPLLIAWAAISADRLRDSRIGHTRYGMPAGVDHRRITGARHLSSLT